MTHRKEYKHYLFLLFIACALFLNYCFSNDILSFVITAVSCAYILLCKKEYYIPSAIFLTAYAFLFRYGDYGIFIFVCLSILLRGLLSNLKHVVEFLVLAIVYAASHLLSTYLNSVETSIGDYIPLFSILCLFATCMNYAPQNKRECIRHSLFGFFTSSILGFWLNATRLGTILKPHYLTVNSWEDTFRFAGLSYDCNFYALSAILVLYFLMFEDQYIFEKKTYMKRYAMLGATALLGMLTFSKMFLLTAVVLLVLAVAFSSRSTKKKLLLSAPCVVVILLLFNKNLTQWLNIMLERLGGATLNDFTTGRSELWGRYIKRIFSDFSTFFIGEGIVAIYDRAAHNTYLEILSKFGFLGMIVDILHIYLANKVLQCGRGSVNKKKFFVCLFIHLLLLFTLSAYTFYGLWVIAFFVMISKQDFTGGENRNGKYNNPGLQCGKIY